MSKVVLADRDPDACRILTDFLAVNGYTVHCCGTGEELLAELESGSPVAVIVELFDMGPGGLGLVWDIAAGRRGPAVPVLVYTSDPRRSLTRDLDTPRTRLLSKPAPPRLVLHTLKMLLGRDVGDMRAVRDDDDQPRLSAQ